MSSNDNKQRRISHSASLPPVAFQVLTPAERRKVHATTNHLNGCDHCNFFAESKRDLQQHQKARLKHADGGTVQCYLCEKRFCMRQTMEAHHKVEHMSTGAFAKLRRAAAVQVQSTATNTLPVPFALMMPSAQGYTPSPTAASFSPDGYAGGLDIGQNPCFSHFGLALGSSMPFDDGVGRFGAFASGDTGREAAPASQFQAHQLHATGPFTVGSHTGFDEEIAVETLLQVVNAAVDQGAESPLEEELQERHTASGSN